MKIIVGLGNPGKKYKNNRHNLGYRVIDRLSDEFGITVDRKKFNSEYGNRGSELLLVKPTTFMNNSGESVVSWVNYFKNPLEGLLVVCDEFSMQLGTIRIRKSGTSSGHNGLNSIISCINTNQFPRLRIGIGAKKPEAAIPEKRLPDLADYVLEDFGPDEKKLVEEMIEKASAAVVEFINNGIESAMNKYNIRPLNHKP